MKNIICFVLILTACTNQSSKKDDHSVVSQSNDIQEGKNIITKPSNDLDFQEFVKKFISDPKFQNKHCIYPLFSLTLSDPTTDIYDTIVVERKIQDFIEIEPSMLETGDYKYQTKKVSSTEAILFLLGVDTGVHVEYLFKIMDEEWMLVEITDLST